MWRVVVRKGLDVVGVMLLMVVLGVVCLLVAVILAFLGWWIWPK